MSSCLYELQALFDQYKAQDLTQEQLVDATLCVLEQQRIEDITSEDARRLLMFSEQLQRAVPHHSTRLETIIPAFRARTAGDSDPCGTAAPPGRGEAPSPSGQDHSYQEARKLARLGNLWASATFEEPDEGYLDYFDLKDTASFSLADHRWLFLARMVKIVNFAILVSAYILAADIIVSRTAAGSLSISPFAVYNCKLLLPVLFVVWFSLNMAVLFRAAKLFRFPNSTVLPPLLTAGCALPFLGWIPLWILLQEVHIAILYRRICENLPIHYSNMVDCMKVCRGSLVLVLSLHLFLLMGSETVIGETLRQAAAGMLKPLGMAGPVGLVLLSAWYFMRSINILTDIARSTEHMALFSGHLSSNGKSTRRVDWLLFIIAILSGIMMNYYYIASLFDIS